MNTDRARLVLQYVGIIRRDQQNRPELLWVPSSPIWDDNKQRGGPRCAIVKLERGKDSRIVLDCQCMPVGQPELAEPCKSGECHAICYHMFAAVEASLPNGGKVMFFRDNQQGEAEDRAKNGDGMVFYLSAKRHDGRALAVYFPPARVKRQTEIEKLTAALAAKEAELNRLKRLKGAPAVPARPRNAPPTEAEVAALLPTQEERQTQKANGEPFPAAIRPHAVLLPPEPKATPEKKKPRKRDK